MQVDLKALDAEMRMNTYPFFTSSHFNSKLNHGWIKHYQYFTRYIALFIIIYIIVNGIAGRIYIEEYTETITTYNSYGYPVKTPTTSAICYAYSCFVLAAFGLFPVVGMYLMSHAISFKNLANQDSALKVFTFSNYFQLVAFIVNYALGPKTRTTGVSSISVFAFLGLALGLGLKIVAHKMRDEMVDKPDSLMPNIFQIIYQYPRFFSDIERRPLMKEDIPL